MLYNKNYCYNNFISLHPFTSIKIELNWMNFMKKWIDFWMKEVNSFQLIEVGYSFRYIFFTSFI